MIESSFSKSSTEVLGNSMASNDEGRLEVKAAPTLVEEAEEEEEEEEVVVVVAAVTSMDDEAVVAV